MRRFVTDKAGATALETAMIAAVLALALGAAAQALGPSLVSVFHAAAQALDGDSSSQPRRGR